MGLVDGYNSMKPNNQRSKQELYLLNSQGDFDDLEYFIDAEKMKKKID